MVSYYGYLAYISRSTDALRTSSLGKAQNVGVLLSNGRRRLYGADPLSYNNGRPDVAQTWPTHRRPNDFAERRPQAN